MALLFTGQLTLKIEACRGQGTNPLVNNTLLNFSGVTLQLFQENIPDNIWKVKNAPKQNKDNCSFWLIKSDLLAYEIKLKWYKECTMNIHQEYWLIKDWDIKVWLYLKWKLELTTKWEVNHSGSLIFLPWPPATYLHCYLKLG